MVKKQFMFVKFKSQNERPVDSTTWPGKIFLGE